MKKIILILLSFVIIHGALYAAATDFKAYDVNGTEMYTYQLGEVVNFREVPQYDKGSGFQLDGVC